MSVDQFNLQRFVDAQNDIYGQVIQELYSQEKRSHWMWFIFPQVCGLGYSRTSKFFAIGSREEAHAFITHPVLGKRLRECVDILLELNEPSAIDVFGDIDAQKLASSMTLFAEVSGAGHLLEIAR